MKTIFLGLMASACLVTAAAAQAVDNNPQPSCKMCPGTYIPLDELQGYIKKAIAEKRVDQQVRDIDIGKAHIGIGIVYRGKWYPVINKNGSNQLAREDGEVEIRLGQDRNEQDLMNWANPAPKAGNERWKHQQEVFQQG